MKLKKTLILNKCLAKTLKSLRSLSRGTEGGTHERPSGKLLPLSLVVSFSMAEA